MGKAAVLAEVQRKTKFKCGMTFHSIARIHSMSKFNLGQLNLLIKITEFSSTITH